MADVAAPLPPVPPRPPARGAVAGWRERLSFIAQRPALLFVQTLSVFAGAVLFVVGGTDVATAATFPSKVFGAGLTVVGIALLATAGGIRSERPWPGTVGSASLGGAAAIAAYLSVRAWDEERPWALLFGAIAAGTVAALVLLVRERRPVFGVKSASVLGVAGFAFTFFQFTFAQSAATRVGPTIVLTPDLVAVGDQRTPETLAVTIKAANKTGARIQLLGDFYVVEGIELCERSRSVADQTLFGEAFSTGDPDYPYTAEVAARDVTTVQAGKVFEDGTYFEPGEEIVRRFSVPVPTLTYDVFRLRVRLAVANGDRLHLGGIAEGPAPIAADASDRRAASPIEANAAGPGASMTWDVAETSLMDRLTHADRQVVVRWESGTGKEVRPRLDVFVRLPDEPGAPTAELANEYGLTYASSSVDIPVSGPVALGPASDGSRGSGGHGGGGTACRADW